MTDKHNLPDVTDYELTFKVNGLSFLFTDMLVRGFGYLRPLFLSKNNDFRQYFPNERMKVAADMGYDWLSQKDGYSQYRQEFENFHNLSGKEIKKILDNELSAESVDRFFEITEKYFEYYSKNDFQFSNSAYSHADGNHIIRENLRQLAKFKDIARVWINELSINDDSSFAQFVDRLSQKFMIAGGILNLYKISELVDLFNGHIVSADDLENRKKAFVIYVQGKTIQYSVGDEASGYIDKLISDNDGSASEISGQVANRTDELLIIGTVRIVNVDYNDLSKMKKEISKMESGEILVSEFTAPELMLACEKAKAIVTDLGGMLSHAAIVSREMGIPCIVGTKHASKLLKTGDKITIDFNIGQIKLQS